MLYIILFEVVLEKTVDETSQMDYVLYCTLLTKYQENEETWEVVIRTWILLLSLLEVWCAQICLLGIAQMK